MGLTKCFVASFLILLVTGCASKKAAPEPEWIHSATRAVDSGYIVYVATGEDRTLERARFKAESEAISDLANECSFPPKGTRIEDTYDQPNDKGHLYYAKVGVTFEECEAAKKAVDPSEVKALANLAMTEQVKQYQEMIGQAQPEEGLAPAVASAGSGGGTVYIQNNPQYFYARQNIWYQKQVVILAPPNTYVVGAPQTVAYYNRVTPSVTQVQVYERANPAVANLHQGGWSTYRSMAVAQPHQFNQNRPQNSNRPIARPHRRRRHGANRPKVKSPYRG
jgi:hypothetical protein